MADTTPDPRELRQDELSEYALTSELYSLTLKKTLMRLRLSRSQLSKDDILIRRDNDRHDWFADPQFTFLNSYFDPETNVQKTVTQEFLILLSQHLECLIGL